MAVVNDSSTGAGTKPARTTDPRRTPAARPAATTSGAGDGVSMGKRRRGYRVGGENVYDYYARYFRQQGYGDLGNAATRILNSGKTGEEFWTELRSTPAYAQRFAGNIARQKAGLPMLDEGEYIQAEENYRSVFRKYGLPEGFYDDPSDFANFISEGISPDEIDARAKMASDLVSSKDPALRNELKDMGLGKGDLTAYFLDPDRALPALQKKFDTALVGAEAERAGFKGINTGFNRKLVDAGIDAGAARTAYQDAARDRDTLEKLADMDKTNISTKGIVKANLDLDPKAARKIRKIEGSERSRFRGSSSGTGSLGGTRAGSY